jgi:dTDP-glucose 4,6-dehydratase
MKLLITGGLGFIGSNFIINVLKRSEDYEIVNVDAEHVGSNHKNLLGVRNSDRYKFVKGNIADKKLMNALASECDAVINFAAESHVDRSITDAAPFIDSNIYGVFVILEILRDQKKRLVHVSTDEVFGSLEKDSASEEHRFNPSSPYSASKAAAELLINSYVTTYNIDAVITRCTNNYGPMQFPEKLIPKAILFAKENKKIPIMNKGIGIRDWIYVDDHCEAILKVLREGRRGESYNISAGNEIDVITLVKKILHLMDVKSELYEFVQDRPGHDYRYGLDSSKIRKELGWKPRTSFEDGIKKTIDWYLINYDHWK